MKIIKTGLKIGILGFVIISCLTVSINIKSHPHEMPSAELKEKCAAIDFQKYDSLLIVAHPDDETIWGGNHLQNGNYLVLCITNGDHEKRAKEFEEVMKLSNTKGIILSYPDKTDGKRDDWQKAKKAISQDINYMILQKNWKQIVTHNPDGEYGHQHHIMTSQLVTAISQKEKMTDKLMYFGKYVKRKQIKEIEFAPMLENPLEDHALKQKKILCDSYGSQNKVMKNLAHMLPYENWISYANWH